MPNSGRGFSTPVHIVRSQVKVAIADSNGWANSSCSRDYRGILADSRDLAWSNRSPRVPRRFSLRLRCRHVWKDVMHRFVTLMRALPRCGDGRLLRSSSDAHGAVAGGRSGPFRYIADIVRIEEARSAAAAVPSVNPQSAIRVYDFLVRSRP